MLDGRLVRRGRQLRLRLYYDRSFAPGAAGDGSWTVRMRPDCSLSIRPASDEPHSFEPVWLHFDAKYRIDALGELVDDPDETADGDAAGRSVGSRRDDLLKMHAYRDAVRRSAGAYVIFPGDEERRYAAYHEVLPGVGAFPLMPRADGDPTGAENLRRFIDDVLDHVASRLTARERSSFWTARAYDRQDLLRAGARRPQNLPPADTPVLLGYVRHPGQHTWIERTHLYNLRADSTRRGAVSLTSRELDAHYVLLYGPGLPDTPELWRTTGELVSRNAEQLVSESYPTPGGEHYICLVLDTPSDLARLLTPEIVDVLLGIDPTAMPLGAPRLVSLADLLAAFGA